MRGEVGAGSLRVAADLCGELLKALEFLFRAQEGEKLQSCLAAVEIAGVVKQMALSSLTVGRTPTFVTAM